VDRYEVAWGEVHSVEKVGEYLSSGTYRAVTVTHCETSTGALNSIRAVSDKAHEHDVLCLVDSVSAAGGAELRFDEWGLDFVLTGSQKALALPPGLAFGIASEQVVALASEATNRGVYFDIVEMDRFAATNQVPATPAFSLLYALEVQLESILAEGIEARWARHSAMARATADWLERTPVVTNIVAKGFQSPTVSTIRLPDGLSGKAFVQKVREHGITVGGGYGKLGETTFRIGHMGDHTVETIERCLTACTQALTS
jgi:aspartate aminotransferase-like enzyme